MDNKLILPGLDNYGKPRQNFADRLSSMTEQEYHDKTKDIIWLSAYANNNPRSDYHKYLQEKGFYEQTNCARPDS